MAASLFYVRLKPFNPKRGFKLRRYTVFGLRFEVEAGWYKLDDSEVAAYLKTIHNDNNNPDSPLAFDVCTPEEWEKKLEEEQTERIRKGEIAPPIGMTRDLTAPSRAKVKEAAAKRATMEHIGHPDPGAMTTADIPSLPPERALPPEPELSPPPDILPPPPTSAPDDLTKIKGVGESTAAKLASAGLDSYAKIASADLDQLKDILGRQAKKVRADAAERLGG
jgi:predicted flap endonuclease-1-like 5' DNA nuclease